MSNTIYLILEGPLQSWGDNGRWVIRDTASEPTKSGIIGLLGCALGIHDDQGLADLSQSLKMGVRCDQPGTRLEDYQTVHEGVWAADRKIKINATSKKPETVVSWRYYLADAVFLVALQGEKDLIDRLADALQKPVWPYYLGRRSCVPTRPVFAGKEDRKDLIDALKNFPFNGRDKEKESLIRSVLEVEAGKGVRKRDNVGQNSLRRYLSRYTEEIYIKK
ncbi:MAG: type I-E CRISPR-associated protein Cas5/CasD [Anaerolineaceae bacterium]|nr:type I-E CRISPR-associated protein Cas5/CasD [Anaerolineaceae bacterium]